MAGYGWLPENRPLIEMAVHVSQQVHAPQEVLDLLNLALVRSVTSPMVEEAARVDDADPLEIQTSTGLLSLEQDMALSHSDNAGTTSVGIEEIVASGGIALETWLETVNLGYQATAYA